MFNLAPRTATIVSVLGGLLFQSFVPLQFNDPDPFLWIALYQGVALISFLHARHAVPRVVLAACIVICLVWAVTLLLQTSGRWFGGEVEREFGGVMLCLCWLLYLTFMRRVTL
jgi:hypothetical protein